MKKRRVLLVFGLILSLFGVMESIGYAFPLSVVAGDLTHNFVQVQYYDTWNGFTDISCSMSTENPTSFTTPYAASFWIAMTASDYNPVIGGNATDEFMQMGTVALYNVSGYSLGPHVFWATFGPVDNTNYQGQFVANAVVGSTYTYRIFYDGKGWSLVFDGKQIQYVAFPYKSWICEIDEETTCITSFGAGNVNAGIVSFTNTYATNNGTQYNFLSIPQLAHGFFAETIDTGTNGLALDSPTSLRMGWGLPTQVSGNPFAPNPPPPPTPTPNPLQLSITPEANMTTWWNGTPFKFTATASAGSAPYNVQWYVNDVLSASDTTQRSMDWYFQPPNKSQVYHIYASATDSKQTTAKSDTVELTIISLNKNSNPWLPSELNPNLIYTGAIGLGVFFLFIGAS